MAQRGAPDPEPEPGPDPEGPVNGTAGPFLGALAIIVVIIVAVIGAQIFSPADEGLSDGELVNRTVADYISAHNENDQQILERLRCSDLPADEAPLADAEGRVELQAAQNITVEGERATVDVRATVGGELQTDTWHVTRVGDVWRVCTP